MIGFIYRRGLLAAGGSSLAGLVWVWLREASPDRKEIENMKGFTDRLKTYCVGRFLIDAPASVQETSGNYGLRIASVEARPSAYKVASMVAQALDVELQQREAELRRQPLTPKGGSRFLGSSRGGSAVRVVYYFTPGLEPDGKADGYVARDGGVFFFQTNAYQESDARELLDFLVEIEPCLTVLAPGTIPRTPGFCIGSGLIATNPKRGESVNGWGWTLPGHPDVRFNFSTGTNQDRVPLGIVDREGSILKEAGLALMQRVRTLRKRRFEIAGMPAQEWLIEVTDQKPEYQLDLEVPGLSNDNLHPRIDISMRVGGYGVSGYSKPSLSTGEALALWDSLISTLRVRPGSV